MDEGQCEILLKNFRNENRKRNDGVLQKAPSKTPLVSNRKIRESKETEKAIKKI